MWTSHREFRTFYQRTVRIIACDLRRRGVDKVQDLEVIIRDTYQEAFHRRDQLRCADAALPWLLTIAQRHHLHTIAGYETTPETVNKRDCSVATASPPDDLTIGRLTGSHVLSLIDSEFPEKKRIALMLFFLGNSNRRLISTELRVTQLTLLHWLHDFCKRLADTKVLSTEEETRSETPMTLEVNLHGSR